MLPFSAKWIMLNFFIREVGLDKVNNVTSKYMRGIKLVGKILSNDYLMYQMVISEQSI